MKLNFKPTYIVILTGAGISAESGISTFRDSGGLWENHDIHDVASPSGFHRDPELVHRFYNLRREQLVSGNIHPNQAHLALSKLQKESKAKVIIITQNVDNLHEMAGSIDIIHMHGELLKMRCIKSGKIFTIKKNISHLDPCPCCLIAGNLRPHIVWFGEKPLQMEEITKHLTKCDLFISIGTSGSVYPAAMFVETAKSHHAFAIEANIEATNISKNFDIHLTGPASQTVETLVEEIITSQ